MWKFSKFNTQFRPDQNSFRIMRTGPNDEFYIYDLAAYQDIDCCIEFGMFIPNFNPDEFRQLPESKKDKYLSTHVTAQDVSNFQIRIENHCLNAETTLPFEGILVREGAANQKMVFFLGMNTQIVVMFWNDPFNTALYRCYLFTYPLYIQQFVKPEDVKKYQTAIISHCQDLETSRMIGKMQVGNSPFRFAEYFINLRSTRVVVFETNKQYFTVVKFNPFNESDRQKFDTFIDTLVLNLPADGY